MTELKWVSVYECMPTMKTVKLVEDERDYLESDFVLVWDGCKFDVAQAISDTIGLNWVDQYAGKVEAKFWMPLPTPPEG